MINHDLDGYTTDSTVTDSVTDSVNVVVDDSGITEYPKQVQSPTNYQEWVKTDLKRDRVSSVSQMRAKIQLEIERVKSRKSDALIVVENRDFDCPNAELYLQFRKAFPGNETKEDLKKIPELISKYSNK